MTTIGAEPIHLGTHPAAWNRVAIHEDGVRRDGAVGSRTPSAALNGGVRAIGRDEDVDASFPTWLWSTLVDGVMLLGVVWSIPVLVLVIGTPFALAFALLLRLVRLALGAF